MPTFDPCRTARKLAYNNALANHRLHGACSRLMPGEFEAVRVSFFPSIKATLNHILTVDWFYVDALEGGTLGPSAWDIEEPFDDIATLATEQAKVDRRLVAFCEAATPEKAGVGDRDPSHRTHPARADGRRFEPSVPASDTSSRSGSRDVGGNERAPATARRIHRRRRWSIPRRRYRRPRLE